MLKVIIEIAPGDYSWTQHYLAQFLASMEALREGVRQSGGSITTKVEEVNGG